MNIEKQIALIRKYQNRATELDPLKNLAETKMIASLLPVWVKVGKVPHKKIQKALGLSHSKNVGAKLKNSTNFTPTEIENLLRICLKYEIQDQG